MFTNDPKFILSCPRKYCEMSSREVMTIIEEESQVLVWDKLYLALQSIIFQS